MHHLYIGIIVPSTIVLPIAAVLVRYKTAPRPVKVLFYYLLAMAVLYLASGILAARGRNNLFLVHADTIIESIFLLWFFQLIFNPSPLRKWIRVLLVAFPLLCCINFLLWQSPQRYNTYTRPLEALIVITLSILYWWYKEADMTWSDAPFNWIISGLLLYFSSAFLLFALSNFLMPVSNVTLNGWVWKIHATLILIMYLLFAIGFYKCRT